MGGMEDPPHSQAKDLVPLPCWGALGSSPQLTPSPLLAWRLRVPGVSACQGCSGRLGCLSLSPCTSSLLRIPLLPWPVLGAGTWRGKSHSGRGGQRQEWEYGDGRRDTRRSSNPRPDKAPPAAAHSLGTDHLAGSPQEARPVSDSSELPVGTLLLSPAAVGLSLHCPAST